MFELLIEIKILLERIKDSLDSINDKSSDIKDELSCIAGRGIYNLDDIGKMVDFINDKIEYQ